MRMDGSVTDPRLRLALLTAIAEVNADLYEFREKQRAQGYASPADVPADVIDGESQRLMLYRRAVFCWAKANWLSAIAILTQPATEARKPKISKQP